MKGASQSLRGALDKVFGPGFRLASAKQLVGPLGGDLQKPVFRLSFFLRQHGGGKTRRFEVCVYEQYGTPFGGEQAPDGRHGLRPARAPPKE